MRTEKEIRDRIAKLQKLEDRAAKDIKEMVENNEMDLLNVTIDRANIHKTEKQILQWVLGDT